MHKTKQKDYNRFQLTDISLTLYLIIFGLKTIKRQAQR